MSKRTRAALTFAEAFLTVALAASGAVMAHNHVVAWPNGPATLLIAAGGLLAGVRALMAFARTWLPKGDTP